MTTWDRLCRICTSPAEYNYFEKIPTYLHGNINEFLNWQKPISEMVEETTGLKTTPDDGLPRNICAVCISYLKHAVQFRTQTIANALSLKAIHVIRQDRARANAGTSAEDRQREKDSTLITEADLHYSSDRETDTNLLGYRDGQDKVEKELLNNKSDVPVQSKRQLKQQMRYLNLLFDKRPNNNDNLNGWRRKNRNDTDKSGAGMEKSDTGDDQTYGDDDDFQTASSSSDDERSSDGKKDGNIFSYREKNFEEDDIMDTLGGIVNIPESCKERKCRACNRRFMFDETFQHHMQTCIEFKFLTYIEEMNRLLYIRRRKAVSPHEFIRRMIFCLRKTCEWLKAANCGDIYLPDLMASGGEPAGHETTAAPKLDNPIEIARDNSQQAKPADVKEVLRNKIIDMFRKTRVEETKQAASAASASSFEANNFNRLQQQQLQRNSGALTPITAANNILYEIERSQSRSSHSVENPWDIRCEGATTSSPTMPSAPLRKPIAVLATNTAPTTTPPDTVPTMAARCESSNNIRNAENDRFTFLQKLQMATKPPTRLPAPIALQRKPQPTASPKLTTLTVRTDLLTNTKATISSTTPTDRRTAAAGSGGGGGGGDVVIEESMDAVSQSQSIAFIARCKTCNLAFSTLAALEVHNATRHNHLPDGTTATTATTAVPRMSPLLADQLESEEAIRVKMEHNRIIALFEDDDI